jgi:hypothetical protein
MATSRQDIERWFDRGVQSKATYMIVFFDTFDHEDYRSYFKDRESAVKAKESVDSMTRYMESYDLMAPKDPQLDAPRAHCL